MRQRKERRNVKRIPTPTMPCAGASSACAPPAQGRMRKTCKYGSLVGAMSNDRSHPDLSVPADPAIRLVGGRYCLTGKIGEGTTKQAEVVARFQREAQVVGQVRHRNVVEVLDSGVENGISFMVMELLADRAQGAIPALASAGHRNSRPISHARAALVLCCVFLGSCTHRALVWVPELEDLSCRVDSDCTIATEVGCCGCQVQPYAVSRSKEEERLSNCSVALCACQGICLCPPIADPGQFRPACERNRCVQRPLERQVINSPRQEAGNLHVRLSGGGHE